MTKMGEAEIMRRRSSDRNKVRTRLTAPVQPIISPRALPRKVPHGPQTDHHFARPQTASRKSKDRSRRQGSAPPDRRHDRDHARRAPGVGLAAIQVAEPLRLLVVDTAKKRSRRTSRCSSIPRSSGRPRSARLTRRAAFPIPEYYAEVEAARLGGARPRALDREGKEREVLSAEGLLATVLQHEIDHLDGVLFIGPHFQAQARPGDQEIPESRQARRRRLACAVGQAGRSTRRSCLGKDKLTLT